MNTPRRGRLDAVVAGGGVVGATTALVLAREGLSVALVEPKRPLAWERDRRDLRVYASAPDNARLLQDLGVWQRVAAARVQPYRGMRVWDAAGGDPLVFDADALGQQQLGWIVENGLLVDALWQALPEAGVRLHCPARIEALAQGTGLPSRAACELEHVAARVGGEAAREVGGDAPEPRGPEAFVVVPRDVADEGALEIGCGGGHGHLRSASPASAASGPNFFSNWLGVNSASEPAMCTAAAGRPSAPSMAPATTCSPSTVSSTVSE